MIMGSAGLDLLKNLEGYRCDAYRDVAGNWTIGVGHLLSDEEVSTRRLKLGNRYVVFRLSTDPVSNQTLAMENVNDLLSQDLERFEKCVNSAVTVAFAQHQFDALVSFAFNVGTTAFRSSTLVRVLNDGHYDKVPGQMRRWNKAGGKVVKGLINRREKEIKHWLSDSDNVVASPRDFYSAEVIKRLEEIGGGSLALGVRRALAAYEFISSRIANDVIEFDELIRDVV